MEGGQSSGVPFLSVRDAKTREDSPVAHLGIAIITGSAAPKGQENKKGRERQDCRERHPPSHQPFRPGLTGTGAGCMGCQRKPERGRLGEGAGNMSLCICQYPANTCVGGWGAFGLLELHRMCVHGLCEETA